MVVLLGTALSGPDTTVAFGDLLAPAAVATPTRVEARIPDNATPSVLIPAERQLQPGVRSVRVVARDPLVPYASFGSNEAALMLVPSVATLAYAGGPPRATLTINGNRLMSPTGAGETIVGRAVVPATAYRTGSTPAKLIVPVPPQLPTRDVHLVLGGVLADNVALGPGPHTLSVTIGPKTVTRSRSLPASLPRADLLQSSRR